MRIALVSPYSWTYPGGVRAHVDALAGELLAAGHEARILTPYDAHDARSARRHRGVWPQAREIPPHVRPLGATVGLPANGAVSNLALSPAAVFRLREELRVGAFDVVHVHEPIAPVISWDALGVARAPLVGTFHTYSTNTLTNTLGNLAGARRRMQRLRVRIAVSRAAQWTGIRYFGGSYRVIPNGVAVPERIERPPPVAPSEERPLRLAFVGQAVERKGLPLALRAFAALRERIPATFDVVGPGPEQLAPFGVDLRGVRAHGRVDDEARTAVLAGADLLVAPSLGGESFGMVLTEAFAVGTPVVASRIAGYRDVVGDGVEGVLFARGDAAELERVLLELAADAGRRARMSAAAAERARQYAWPRVAAQVLEAYADAIAMPAPEGPLGGAAVRLGMRSAAGGPRRAAQRRLPSLE